MLRLTPPDAPAPGTLPTRNARHSVAASAQRAARPDALSLADAGLGELFGRTHEAVIVGNVETGRIALWNPAAERLLGYTASEAIGQPMEMLMPPAIARVHRDCLERYTRTGHGAVITPREPMEVPALAKNGDEVRVELSLAPLEVPSTRERYVIAMLSDISDRTRAERLSVENARAGSARADAEATLRQCNDLLREGTRELQVALARLQRSAARLAARSAAHNPPTEPTERTERTERTEPTERTERTEQTEQTEQTERTEQTEQTEQTERTEPTEPTELSGSTAQEKHSDSATSAGSRLPTEMSTPATQEGSCDVLGRAALHTPTAPSSSASSDLATVLLKHRHDQTRADSADQRLNGLAPEEARSTSTAPDPPTELAKSSTAAAVPVGLAASRSSRPTTGVARSEVRHVPTDSRRGQLLARVVEYRTADVRRMLDQIADATAVRTGTFELRPERINVVPLVARIVRAARARWTRHKLTSAMPQGLTAVVDAPRVEQFLEDVLGRAVRRNPRGCWIDVDVRRPLIGLLQLEVRDYGRPLTDEEFDRLLDPPGPDRGWYLNKYIVEQHGGTLTLERPAEGGLRVVATLPTRPG